MLRKLPFVKRIASKLVFELLPGAVVSMIGAMLLNQYYKPTAAPVAVAVTQTNDDVVAAIHVEQARLINYLAQNKPEPIVVSRVAKVDAKPQTKPPETKTARLEKREKRLNPKPRLAAEHQTPVNLPLERAQLTVAAAQPIQPAPPPPAPAEPAKADDSGIMAKLHGVVASVQDIPSRLRAAVTFGDTPPRPPAPIGQDFRASM